MVVGVPLTCKRPLCWGLSLRGFNPQPDERASDRCEQLIIESGVAGVHRDDFGAERWAVDGGGVGAADRAG